MRSRQVWIILLLGTGTGQCSSEEPAEHPYPPVATRSCGNDRVETGEVCDGSDLGTATCENLGYGAGDLGCKAGCTAFDLAQCGAPTTCGNNRVDDPEVCDGNRLAGESCETLGFGPGPLTCLDNCLDFDTTSCGPPLDCGNNRIDDPEVCDGGKLGGVTCGDLGFEPGEVECAADCLSFVTTNCGACIPACGDRVCGPDPHCRESCGSCPDGTCNSEGQCIATPDPTRFATSHTRWPVPKAGGLFPVEGFWSAAWSGGAAFWTTMDINGDGLPDLVHTADASDTDGVVWHDAGGDFWKVYQNMGSRFAATHTRWPVPAVGGLFAVEGFWSPAWFGGAAFWNTMDIDGDGLPDLVHTADSSDTNGVVWSDAGGDFWKVYQNTGAGFADAYSRWPVPKTGGLFSVEGFWSPFWAGGAAYWTTRDIDGDGLPDLVHTADSSDTDGVVWSDAGGDFWKVYQNTGAGFAEIPFKWRVPEAGGLFPVEGFWSASWSGGAAYWTTMDLNGDALPDLVHTADSSDTDGVVWHDAGGDFWKVYPNTGSRFATTHTRWPVPEAGGLFPVEGFWSAFWSGGAAYWTTMDLNGDALPDLVHTADSSDTDGVVWRDGNGGFWKVYQSSGSGFADTALKWRIPEAGGLFSEESFWSAFWSGGAAYWTTMDLNGDSFPDLLHTADSSDIDGVVWSDGGGDFWKVYWATP